MPSDPRGKAALLAAVSALGLSLGVAVPATALADESPKEHGYQKPVSKQLKLDSDMSGQIKGESHQIKIDGKSHQIKGESHQIKIDGKSSPQ